MNQSRSDEIVCRKILVTPEMAEKWLAKNPHNRAIVRSRVVVHKRQIDDGTFACTHQGIAFYGDFEELADGQHRLSAIVEAGKAVQMMVTSGLPRDFVHAIDLGRPRSVSNVLNFEGLSLRPNEVATARAMWLDYHASRNETAWSTNPIDTRKFSLFVHHVFDALVFSVPSKKCRGLSHASVNAALAAAWFTQDRDKLHRFKKLLHDGVGAFQEEIAAMKLREYLLTTRLASGGSTARMEIYFRACNAVRLFLEGRQVLRLHCRPDARFPIPECSGIAETKDGR